MRGTKEFTEKYAALPAGQGAITATVTAPDGSTSEFSPCLKINGYAPTFLENGVIPASSTVAVTSSATKSTAADIAGAKKPGKKHSKAKPPVGRGVLTLLCPPRTSGSCAGTLLITTTARHPVTIARRPFGMGAGLADAVSFTVPASPFAQLEHTRRMTVTATISAHDGAKRRHGKHATARLTLTYAS